jgi:hypothetical protein
VWGDQDLLDEHAQDMIERSEMVCGGDAISIDPAGQPMDRECLGCGTQWTVCVAKGESALLSEAHKRIAFRP